MSRISATFGTLRKNSRKALIPFITAGDPDQETTILLMHALVSAGADIIELGIPFSDPMADGPVIQRSYERALLHKINLDNVLEMVAEFRKENIKTPVVLMGYANPIEAIGHQVFSEKAKESGIDGVLVVDYPPEECGEWLECLNQNNMDAIFLLSPTTPDRRILEIAKRATGFIYYVSLKGVTGSAHLNLKEVENKLANLRSYFSIPIGVGFGIHDSETAKSISELADAVVIGSRLIREIEESSKEKIIINVSAFVRDLRVAIDR
tara:strand:+ start:13185 stop:13982 length:798 start_codon:yes stop_codon:yes gene_type:complete